MAEETCSPLISGVQSTDFSRVFCLAREGPTKVGTLYAVKRTPPWRALLLSQSCQSCKFCQFLFRFQEDLKTCDALVFSRLRFLLSY